MPVLPTGVSKVFWCNPRAGYEFEEAAIPTFAGDQGAPLAWLDRLLENGVVIPDQIPGSTHALTILLTGPPGTGKSTLATELCYRWSTSPGLRSLYITTEAHEPWMVANATDFGWDAAAFGRSTTSGITLQSLKTTRDLDRWLTLYQSQSASSRGFINTIGEFLIPQHRNSAGVPVAASPTTMLPDVVVVDSLNTVPFEDQSDLFDRFTRVAESGPKILIVILDSSPERATAFWEFISDIVIKLDRESAGYLVRTIEIVKARYQAHVWGRHQLKIYSAQKPLPAGDASNGVDATHRMREHPYRSQGGIFIFPSIHYYLSVYKRKNPAIEPGSMPSRVRGLDTMLMRGYPEGRCIAFLGGRGGHKSHLGYVELLAHVLRDSNNRGLVISLRDDEGVTKTTMQRVLDEEFDGQPLSALLEQDKIEVMYYPPGYITPEEFIHRLFLSIHRLKSGGAQLTLLFNSIDQLKSRFPLCAREDMFVPGIVQMLSAEEVTSFFVAAHELDQPPEYYGLESMAELIFSFFSAEYTRQDYANILMHHYADKANDIAENLGKIPDTHRAVVARVVRFAGGQAAGAAGLLELVGEGHPLQRLNLRSGPGLEFIPFA